MLYQNFLLYKLTPFLWAFILSSCGKSIGDVVLLRTNASEPKPAFEEICPTSPEAPECISSKNDGNDDQLNHNDENDLTSPNLAKVKLAAFYPGSEMAVIFLKNSGASAMSCLVEPALPAGLTIEVHEGGCLISGSPQAIQPSTDHTVTATAINGKSDSATVTIAIEKSTIAPVLIPPASEEYAEPLVLTNLGLDAVTCFISPDLPEGLNVEPHAGTCQIVGIPDEPVSASYLVTAKASNGSEGSVSIKLSAVAAPKPLLANVGSRAFEVGVEIAAFNFSNGGASVKDGGCSVVPDLPDGFSLSAHHKSCRISGTPTAVQPTTTYTVTGEALNGSSDSATVGIAIADTTPPQLSSQAVTASSVLTTSFALSWTKATDLGTAQSDLEYKVCYGGSAPAADCSTGSVAQDFTSDIDTATVTGLSSYTTYYFQVVVKDSNGNLASYSPGSVVTAMQPPILGDLSAQSFEVGSEITALNFANSGAPVKDGGCSADPSLPDGLILSVQDRSCSISGTPTALQASTLYTVEALAVDGSSDSASVSIAVVDTTAPVIANKIVTTASVSRTSMALSWAKATDLGSAQSELEYKVCYDTSAPAADCSTGMVAEEFSTDIATATLENLSSNLTYHFQVVVRDASGNSASYTAGSQTTEANPPVIHDQDSKSFVTTVTFEAFDFGSDGAPIVSCSITPLLSAGLAFDATNCEISGTPSAAQSSRVHTITATAGDGSTDTATVTIEVIAANPPVFSAPPDQNYVTTVPVSFGLTNTGSPAINCLVTPELPSGLSIQKNLDTCYISGTAHAAASKETFYVKATGADGSQGEVAFDVAVADANPPVLVDVSDPVVLYRGEEMDALTFSPSGGTIIDCEVNPELPAGLILSESTCAITGTPTVLQAETTYTVTATATDSTKGAAAVVISVLEPPLACPEGYIPVPTYQDDDTGTVHEFCVMKYEAKNDGDNNAVSVPQGLPWYMVSRDVAISRCQEIEVEGYIFDLITNSQWQSIARQIERYEVDGAYVNWQNNSRSGANALNRGNSSSGSPLAASADDLNGCSGTASPVNCNHTWHPYKRTHTLPNGEVIWDLSGNVNEWIKDDFNYYLSEELTFSYSLVSYWSLATSDSGNACILPECAGPQGKPKAAFGPYGDYTDKLNAPYGGLGHIFSEGLVSIGGTRGGSFYNDVMVGVFAFRIEAFSHLIVADAGFRCIAVRAP